MGSFWGRVSIERWGLTAVSKRLKRKKKKEGGALCSGCFTALSQKAVLLKNKSVVTMCPEILVYEL